uniref:Uncharacterized protein n=1 Tax=Lactuca sativa TaxID=4236 RepID=A0A9R1UCQ8_LACSA|nr:hypothetical protein LSAT_V11C900482490 [Lactuca sativa]
MVGSSSSFKPNLQEEFFIPNDSILASFRINGLTWKKTNTTFNGQKYKSSNFEGELLEDQLKFRRFIGHLLRVFNNKTRYHLFFPSSFPIHYETSCSYATCYTFVVLLKIVQVVKTRACLQLVFIYSSETLLYLCSPRSNLLCPDPQLKLNIELPLLLRVKLCGKNNYSKNLELLIMV